MLRKIIISIVLQIFLFALTSSKPVAEEGIKVIITNLRNDKGHVLVSLFKDGAGYPDDASKAFRKIKLNIINKNASVIFKGLASGNYAIAILHDENDDQKMNKNGLGLPKEGYGFSNNVMGAFGPPS
ncbi:MAG: DUF2141 domain-containing protein [Chitinophagaceae bacterium]|nr:DUF2141 domain-containing protein [Chitinophagaceae bacterium]